MDHPQAIDVVVSPSASRTAPALTPVQFQSQDAVGVIVVVDVTVAGTGSITPSIEGYDPASGKWYPILTGAAIVTAITTVLAVYPGAVAVANLRAELRLPRIWRVNIVHNNGNAITYSVGASLLP